MRTKHIVSFLYCSFFLMSCEFQCSVGSDKNGSKGKEVASSVRTENGATITNGINIKTSSVKLKSATLELENGERLSDDNMVSLNQKIYLSIILENTWKVENNRSFIGASEKIITDDGSEVLNAEDLFSNFDESGIDPEDGKAIRLNAVVTSENKLVKHYLVKFRIWDKKSDAHIEGDYTFYIKK